MPDPFVHLHVASGYSLRHGASAPAALVERAAEHGMDTLALTDRDGAYGAVKFAKACMRRRDPAGVRRRPRGRPAVPRPARAGTCGADPAGQPGPGRRLPRAARHLGPAPGHPAAPGTPPGWAALCRLISATHLPGERGTPISTLDLVAEHAAVPPRTGRWPSCWDRARSWAGRWRPAAPTWPATTWTAGATSSAAARCWSRWCRTVPRATPGAAARALGFAHSAGRAAVLTNVVRYADRSDAPTADVLDASRRLVALDARHVDRRNAEAT